MYPYDHSICDNDTTPPPSPTTDKSRNQKPLRSRKGSKNTEPTKIDSTTTPPKTKKQYPDASKQGRAHVAELEQIDAMNAIDWSLQNPNHKRTSIIPTTMAFGHKHGDGRGDTTRKVRFSVRRDRMRLYEH